MYTGNIFLTSHYNNFAEFTEEENEEITTVPTSLKITSTLSPERNITGIRENEALKKTKPKLDRIVKESNEISNNNFNKAETIIPSRPKRKINVVIQDAEVEKKAKKVVASAKKNNLIPKKTKSRSRLSSRINTVGKNGNVAKIAQKIKGPWQAAEDELLKSQMPDKITKQFRYASIEVPGRTNKQIRDRWELHLSKNFDKSPATDEEKDQIKQLISSCETRPYPWVRFTEELNKKNPGKIRSPAFVKNVGYKIINSKEVGQSNISSTSTPSPKPKTRENSNLIQNPTDLIGLQSSSSLSSSSSSSTTSWYTSPVISSNPINLQWLPMEMPSTICLQVCSTPETPSEISLLECKENKPTPVNSKDALSSIEALLYSSPFKT